MTPDVLWNRYAAIWSLPQPQRAAEMKSCLDEDVTYCDPNGLLTGHAALSDYMQQFQSSVPDGRFQIRAVLHHHGRTLADWTLHARDGAVLQTGSSFGALSEDGRLRAISGFFRPNAQDAAP